jgi:selenocysteine-specific translation elongation factor
VGWLFVAVLSDKPELREKFCKMVGAETSKGELAFYSVDAGGKPLTLIDPVLFPEKVQPLLYSLSMADYVVVLADGVTPKIGEIIVALNCFKMDKGLIVSAGPLPVAGTTLEKFEKAADLEAAKAKLSALPQPEYRQEFVALVDRMENVKSVGNVAHGVIRSGTLKPHDKLFVLPEKKEVEVRSVQVNGKDVPEASAGALFSMAFKGDAFERGILVPMRNEFEIGNIVNGRFSKTPFFRDELKGKIHAYTNLQFVEGHMTDNDLTLGQPIAYEKGEIMLVVDASNQKLRIAGPFQSKW